MQSLVDDVHENRGDIVMTKMKAKTKAAMRRIAHMMFACIAVLALTVGVAFADEAQGSQSVSFTDAPMEGDLQDPTRADIEAEGEIGGSLVAQAASEDGVSMLRLYNPYTGEHLYTASKSERVDLVERGWQFEGVGWVAPEHSNTPVYRLYNPHSGDHHYTMDRNEYDTLATIGWNQEGVGWYSDDAKTVPLYRQFNPNETIGTHNYTTDKNENDTLGTMGWELEGFAWYALSTGNNAFKSSYIYLDAGHGMGSSNKGQYDSGAVGNGYEEAKLTEELVELTAQYARDLYGMEVYANVGDGVQYWNRQAAAKNLGCTSLVSIHFNASDGGGTGTESYIHSSNAAEGSSRLQSIMHEHLVDGMGLRDRGKKKASLSVCSGKSTGLPATLLEVCFIDNSYDMGKYMKNKDKVARELAEGLYEAAQAGF